MAVLECLLANPENRTIRKDWLSKNKNMISTRFPQIKHIRIIFKNGQIFTYVIEFIPIPFHNSILPLSHQNILPKSLVPKITSFRHKIELL